MLVCAHLCACVRVCARKRDVREMKAKREEREREREIECRKIYPHVFNARKLSAACLLVINRKLKLVSLLVLRKKKNCN